MKTKRNKEGYLLIDHRASPGMSGTVGGPVVGENALFEAATITCSHCRAIVIVNPDRTRPRAYCRSCDHYICDVCGKALQVTGICRPFKQVIEDVQELAIKGD